MKITVNQSVVRADNCHDILRSSFIRFLVRKKPSIFDWKGDTKSESGYDSNMHATFNSSKYTTKEIKPIVSAFKKEWLNSDSYLSAGFAKSQLLERGWTKGAIEKWLGGCDIEVDNPHYKSGAPMQIYSLNRVLKAESKEDWQEWYENSLNKRSKLSNAGKERVEKIRSELMNQVHSLNISFPKMTRQKLRLVAVNHYNDSAIERGKNLITKNDLWDDSFLNRITVNYLRHCYNEYDERLWRMTGMVGNRDAYVVLKTRILSQIASQYPHLASEAGRQASRYKQK